MGCGKWYAINSEVAGEQSRKNEWQTIIVLTSHVIALPSVVHPCARGFLADVDIRDEKVEG